MPLSSARLPVATLKRTLTCGYSQAHAYLSLQAEVHFRGQPRQVQLCGVVYVHLRVIGMPILSLFTGQA